uniref:Integrase zinc-binding domain-containing protein n=1 Tax=Megaselia scalaris TaxID=36166 RepID=T1GBQ2_MEGSC
MVLTLSNKDAKLIVDEKEKERILREFYDNVFGGHQGREKSFDKFRRQFFWKGLYLYVDNFIKKCEDCNDLKMKTDGINLTEFERNHIDNYIIANVNDNDNVDKLTFNLLTAFKKSCKLVRHKDRKQPRWWTKDID